MDHQRKFTPVSEKFIRVLSDIVIVNVILLFSIVVQQFWSVFSSGNDLTVTMALAEIFSSYARTWWLLTGVSIAVFSFFGFYSKGRTYLTRYKVTRVTQAVAISFLIFAFGLLMFSDFFSVPNSVIIMSWLLTTVVMIGARVWMEFLGMTYTNTDNMEQQIVSQLEADSSVKKVLVTGGGGYIGSALVKRMLENGYQVRLLDLMLFGYEPIEELRDNPNLEIQRGDFRKVNNVLKAMRGVDAVIHLGSIVGDPACAYDENLTFEVNVLATRLVADVAKTAGVERFIFASTCSVYGAGDEILDERSELNPVSLYARSKIACEQILLEMADEDFIPVILRFGTIYGLSGRTRFDLVINLLTAKAIVDGEITVFGGDQWRPFVHVQDAALGVFRALETPIELVAKEIFNIGSNEQNYTIWQIGEIINEIIPDAELKNLGADSDPRNYRVDFSKARNILGLNPEWTVEKGVHQVKDAIESGAVTNYRDKMYSNIAVLKDGGTDQFDQDVSLNSDGAKANTSIPMNFDIQFPKNEPNEIHKKDWVAELVGPAALSHINGNNGTHD